MVQKLNVEIQIQIWKADLRLFKRPGVRSVVHQPGVYIIWYTRDCRQLQ